jgi:cobalt-zinc-cadmium efflux system outer membrane protein
MDRLTTAALAAVFLALAPLRAAAGTETEALTLERALALARERAPRILAAGSRIEEARGRLVGASVLLRENPVVEAAAGPRYSEEDRDTLDREVAIRQGFELGGQRRARVDGAEADVARASAARDDSARRLLREVAVAFFKGLHAQESQRIATSAEEIAGDIASVAERRYRAEDVPILDVNVSRAALARARSQQRFAKADRAAALGELGILLGIEAPEALQLAGELRDRRRFDLVELLARARERSDLRALEAKLAEVEADLQLARGEGWPDLGLGARYARDARDDVVLGELSLSLPIFDRAQGLRAEATARAHRLRIELDAARRAAIVEVQMAFTVYAERSEAVVELETNALPLLDENESLARRSYEAGEMALGELLLVRRETVETRREYLERLLEAAVAAVDVEASAGVLE